MSGVFLAKVSNRQMLQDPNNMISFLEKNDIKSFDELHSFSDGHLAEYNKLAAKYSGYGNQIKSLLAKIEAYDRIKPFLDVVRKSESLKGLAKWRFDRENRSMLDEYPARLKEFRKVVPKGEKIDPQKWQKDMEALIDKRTWKVCSRKRWEILPALKSSILTRRMKSVSTVMRFMPRRDPWNMNGIHHGKAIRQKGKWEDLRSQIATSRYPFYHL